MAKAVEAGHPKSFSALLPPVLNEAVTSNSSMAAFEIVELRAAWFRKWTNRAIQLFKVEADIKGSMPAHLRRILSSKRIALLEEILREEHYPNMGVVEEIKLGTELVNEVPCTGVFDGAFKAAEISTEQLKLGAKSRNKSIVFGVRSSGDKEVDDTVFQKTLEERDSGWLRGPLHLDDLEEGAVISRRFGLRQSSKIRLIDDLSGSMVNMTVQCNETPRPHTTDVIASVVLSMLENFTGDAVGKTFDLKSAYRQLGIRESSLPFSYVACFDSIKRQPAIFQMLAVPFGATRAVYSFLRIAKFLWWIGCKCLRVVWSCFFDDYVTFTREDLADNTESTICLLFELLGWDFARVGEKADPFGKSFSALGIQISLDHFREGRVDFSNTQRRISEVCDLIDGYIASGKLCSKEAVRLRGRLQFADGQLFGRLGKLCLKVKIIYSP